MPSHKEQEEEEEEEDGGWAEKRGEGERGGDGVFFAYLHFLHKAFLRGVKVLVSAQLPGKFLLGPPSGECKDAVTHLAGVLAMRMKRNEVSHPSNPD